MKIKKCTKCGEVKALKEYHKRKDAKLEVCFACKKCTALRISGYYQKNKAIIKKKRKAYYTSNSKKIYIQQKDYRNKNKDGWKEYQKEYHITYSANNKEKLLRAGKIYREINREKIRAKVRARVQTPMQRKKRAVYAKAQRLKPLFRERQLRFQRSYRRNLSDSYVKDVICKRSAILCFADIPPEMIKAQRALLKLGRLIKERTVA